MRSGSTSTPSCRNMRRCTTGSWHYNDLSFSEQPHLIIDIKKYILVGRTPAELIGGPAAVHEYTKAVTLQPGQLRHTRHRETRIDIVVFLLLSQPFLQPPLLSFSF